MVSTNVAFPKEELEEEDLLRLTGLCVFSGPLSNRGIWAVTNEVVGGFFLSFPLKNF